MEPQQPESHGPPPLAPFDAHLHRHNNLLTLVIAVALFSVTGGILATVLLPNTASNTASTNSQTAQLARASTPTSIPTPTPPAILDLSRAWVAGTTSYTHHDLDISFVYPQGLAVNVVDTNQANIEYAQQVGPDKKPLYGLHYVEFTSPEVPADERNKPTFNEALYDNNWLQITVSVYGVTSKTTLDAFLKSHYSGPGIDGETPEYTSFQKGLRPTNEPKSHSYTYKGLGSGERQKKIVWFLHEQKVYIFTIYEPSPNAEYIFDQMIKSITFI